MGQGTRADQVFFKTRFPTPCIIGMIYFGIFVFISDKHAGIDQNMSVDLGLFLSFFAEVSKKSHPY